MRTRTPAAPLPVKKVSAAVKTPARRPPQPPNSGGRKPQSAPVILAPLIAGELGCIAWKMHGRHAVAYVSDVGLAALLLNTDVKNVAKQAMAVYYDRKGKPFAYQVRFASERWDEVVGRLG